MLLGVMPSAREKWDSLDAGGTSWAHFDTDQPGVLPSPPNLVPYVLCGVSKQIEC